ncbi:unnamed protein product [Mytilus coruscus]|uniref:Uncharacterized protein n=1 Tax=Mytilus coruscus TaxID=42192 RepID=A0A6J8B2J5_MYTCO|nr:unnamed protein product [Mytilus coruscus]
MNNIVLPDISGTIGLMIGNNVPDAYTSYDIATGPTGSPHATRSRLGWIIWNLIRNETNIETNAVVNRAQLTTIKEVQDHNNLDYLVRKSINFDFLELLIDDKKENSIEDNYFLKQVNESIKIEDGQYHVAVPFRNKEVKFPNNDSQGLNRLKGLRIKITKSQKFKNDYVSFMNNLFSKGYAVKVPINELNQDYGRVWYIPHHGIYHHKKPNKIRGLFDCSASHMGVSLNVLLLQGPDLANNLLGVLLPFRSEKILYKVT